MGGKAFAHHNPPLETPRMPKEVYFFIKNSVIKALSPGFHWVDTPIEGPAKKDYGDVDVVVSKLNGVYTNKQDVLKIIHQLLGAKAQITEKGHEVAANFAILWPEDLPYPPGYEETSDDDPSSPATAGPSLTPSGSSTGLARTETGSKAVSEPSGERDGKTDDKSPSTKQLAEAVQTKDQAKGVPVTQQKDGNSQNSAPAAPEAGRKRSTSLLQRGMALFPLGRSSRSLSAGSNLVQLSIRAGETSNDGNQNESHVSSPIPETASKALEFNKGINEKSAKTPAKSKPRRLLYVQVDVRFCPSVHSAKYLRFHHAHGDIWQLLGTIIRPFGLTVDNKGLWIRVPEIENANRKNARIFLTSAPDRILEFLGLPVPAFWKPFPDTDAMFKYVAHCPMFFVRPDGNVEQDRHASTANDRRRLNLRPVYREWVEEFKPRCREKGLYPTPLITREGIRDQAFKTYHIQREWDKRLRDHRFLEQQQVIKRDIIRDVCPQPDGPNDEAGKLKRGLLIKAFTKIIINCDDGQMYGIVAPAHLWGADGLYDMPMVRAYCLNMMDTVFEAAMALHGQKNALRQPAPRPNVNNRVG
ncbi:hypothetical protein FSARC_7390 [Fusarium sarcochroum]|uniref:Uncharacterized protein n=1 Tax=Fusarium sarcochroum TaxID=1208366 RepID=A0A8H4X7E5_9HYPO|nr:hypothetical protein FSARC_7390 [Fusarium sarcochroum]